MKSRAELTGTRPAKLERPNVCFVLNAASANGETPRQKQIIIVRLHRGLIEEIKKLRVCSVDTVATWSVWGCRKRFFQLLRGFGGACSRARTHREVLGGGGRRGEERWGHQDDRWMRFSHAFIMKNILGIMSTQVLLSSCLIYKNERHNKIIQI